LIDFIDFGNKLGLFSAPCRRILLELKQLDVFMRAINRRFLPEPSEQLTLVDTLNFVGPDLRVASVKFHVVGWHRHVVAQLLLVVWHHLWS
jgi:hypothetical protein